MALALPLPIALALALLAVALALALVLRDPSPVAPWLPPTCGEAPVYPGPALPGSRSTNMEDPGIPAEALLVLSPGTPWACPCGSSRSRALLFAPLPALGLARELLVLLILLLLR